MKQKKIIEVEVKEEHGDDNGAGGAGEEHDK